MPELEPIALLSYTKWNLDDIKINRGRNCDGVSSCTHIICPVGGIRLQISPYPDNQDMSAHELTPPTMDAIATLCLIVAFPSSNRLWVRSIIQYVARSLI